MQTLLERAIEELRALPPDTQEGFAADVLDMIKSERKWDELFADPRSDAVLKRLAAEADADEVFDFDPGHQPSGRHA